MPAVLPEGLVIAAVLPREDPLDALVLPVRAQGSEPRAQGSGLRAQKTAQPSALSPQPLTLDDLVAVLGQSPSIGTGSVRRIAQLTRLFPGARFAPIRGNLDTRLRRLDEGGPGGNDALVLAAAGLRRLGFSSRISLPLNAGYEVRYELRVFSLGGASRQRSSRCGNGISMPAARKRRTIA